MTYKRHWKVLADVLERLYLGTTQAQVDYILGEVHRTVQNIVCG